MNKIQDGWFSGGDSYKPLKLSTDMRLRNASLSFVGDRIIIRGLGGCVLQVDAVEDLTDAVGFRILTPEDVADID